MIDLGKVLKPQGIKGEIKVEPISDASFFNKINHVIADEKSFAIESASEREGFVYLKLEGINSIDDAEGLRGKILRIERKDLPPLKEGQYFYDDLIDCKLYTKDDKFVGEIVGLQNYGTADLLEIRLNGQFGSSLCPYVVGLFETVDTKQKKIVINEKRFKELTDYED